MMGTNLLAENVKFPYILFWDSIRGTAKKMTSTYNIGLGSVQDLLQLHTVNSTN